MPKSMKEVLDHAEELALRFEAFDPTSAIEISVAELTLRRAVLARAHAERAVLEAVQVARAEGVSWGQIGDLLGTSAQAAQQRYGKHVPAA